MYERINRIVTEINDYWELKELNFIKEIEPIMKSKKKYKIIQIQLKDLSVIEWELNLNEYLLYKELCVRRLGI